MIRPNTPLSHVPREQLPDDLRNMHDMLVGLAGEADNVEVFGNHPALYRWYFTQFYRHLFNGENGDMIVERKFKELIRLKLSLSHGCFVCNSANIPSTLAAGYTQAQIDAIPDPTAEHFNEKELLVLELGEQFLLQNDDGTLSPDLHQRLSEHFSDAEILELGVIAAMLAGWSKMMFVFDIVTREDTCTIGLTPAARPS